MNGHNIVPVTGRPGPERVHAGDLASLVHLCSVLVQEPFRPQDTRKAVVDRLTKRHARLRGRLGG